MGLKESSLQEMNFTGREIRDRRQPCHLRDTLSSFTEVLNNGVGTGIGPGNHRIKNGAIARSPGENTGTLNRQTRRRYPGSISVSPLLCFQEDFNYG
jgi:hypothetical protein